MHIERNIGIGIGPYLSNPTTVADNLTRFDKTRKATQVIQNWTDAPIAPNVIWPFQCFQTFLIKLISSYKTLLSVE